ncbi:hypothetical protein INT43_003311 [Umbelopsis isabellina]|uniref:Uncharacterized protein n=1 Tax=Mortierella isabellina TaxID=91625 RepID=A0A8H7UFK7_MORIS|nr:hypothetical protein INT43_003311 [Umbelopsis isabellina]
MCLAKTETDSISRTDDVLISGSEDGQIIRWNAADGRCLAANAQGFFGIPHSLHVRSNVTNVCLERDRLNREMHVAYQCTITG